MCSRTKFSGSPEDWNQGSCLLDQDTLLTWSEKVNPGRLKLYEPVYSSTASKHRVSKSIMCFLCHTARSSQSSKCYPDLTFANRHFFILQLLYNALFLNSRYQHLNTFGFVMIFIINISFFGNSYHTWIPWHLYFQMKKVSGNSNHNSWNDNQSSRL